MRLNAVTLGATLVSSVAASSHQHGHHHPMRRTDQSSNPLHHAHMAVRDATSNDSSQPQALEKRKKKCSLPSGEGLVEVPGASNGGWALSPDQECTSGSYCPFACPPGKVMAQWKKGSSYTYPSSMDGGVYCNDDGEIEKPFSDSDYCVDGTGAVKVRNEAGSALSFCQTVLPGNEAMLIPTIVSSSATLAVPDTSYWCGTSSHFYINPPGVGSEGCIWGTDSEAIGNWTPYVAGANTASGGETYLKIGWNNEWLQSSLKNSPPDYGLEIECDGGGCNGLPCSIIPGVDDVNAISAPSSGVEESTGTYCVVTIPKGGSATIVVTGGSGSSVSSASSADDDNEDEDEKPKTTSKKSKPTTTKKAESSSTPVSSSSSSEPSTTMSSKVVKTSSKSAKSSKTASSSSSSQSQYDDSGEKGAIFFEQTATGDSTASATGSSAEVTGTYEAAAAPSETQKDEGIAHQGGAVASLVIAMVVGLYLF
ncbi:uncharacterized protein MKZ38_005463 [Zalerion maritima]|uniref:Uncharacterized protein n=1 Tax=Zalerion maritima TaxID=339359 RepID=A0AAD5WQ92_9PEZI|nr:uncharacterized protein MKZ38_005463 [Zalerion maritima]